MKITMLVKTTRSVNMLILRDVANAFFQYFEADKISFADTRNIKTMNVGISYSVNPISVIIDTTVDDTTLVVEIMLVSIWYIIS
ncbi:hypothetical protein J7W08_08110 [Methanococcoides orientis]|uniref:hypothetical protein n=1 Tax=Methanococcoides orientis TaxID=2822137 RepID=UPI001E451112|nr:hypothetical protein [Methanococcoides orientis]UGV40069.1 hypothetical protein J7W08_08110 [Methanococcoides orientis]